LKRAIYAVLLVVIVGGAYVAGSWHGKKSGGGGSAGARKILYYVDPMHPAYKSDKPGIAPDCGMQLEPVYEDGGPGGTGGGTSSMPPGTVGIDPGKRQAIGVRVGTVAKEPAEHTLRVLGRVAADETRLYRINATIDGWITKAYPNSAGSVVRKDEVLAAFYSPEFLSSGQALLFALGSQDRVQTTGRENPAQAAQLEQFEINLKQYRDSLRNLGMGDRQIEEMIRTRKYMENVDLTSPADGIILARNVSQGQRFDKGTEMYRIADLSRVWVLADVYGDEARYLKPGMAVKAVQPDLGKTFGAKVSEILPQFDPATRTLKVRLEADNPGYVLRPDMFVDLEIPVRMPPSLNVPAEAVLDAGTRKTVFVDRGDGYFEPRSVETGWRMGDRVEITKGLMEGEKIVVSGTFLVDSESRMKLAAAGIYGAWHVDPVCAMHVDEGKAKAAGKMVEHGGKTYFFCSDDCVGKFRKEPAKYLKESGPAAKKETPKRAPTADGGHEKPVSAAAGGTPMEEAAAAESDDLPIDPVCGMVVDPMTARAANRVSEYKGKTYYFCADMCRKRFDANPAAFLAKPGQGGMGAGQEGHGERDKDAHGGHGK
jgi:RND family efflux transporter MFP subunit